MPDCDPNAEVTAIREGCWQCVNAATCLPWGTPGCATDDDCEAPLRCQPCGTSSCLECDDCVPACTPLLD